MTIAALLCVILTTIFLIILGPVFPEKDETFGAIGWASKGLFVSFSTAGLIWQLERVNRLVNQRIQQESRKKKITRNIQKNQRLFGFFGLSVGLYYIILSTAAFPWTWINVLVVGYWEITAAVVFELRRSMFSCCFKSPELPLSKHVVGTFQNIHAAPQPALLSPESGRREDDTDYDDEENEDYGSNEDRFFPILGLGIRKTKFKRPKFIAKMSRVTEVSETRDQNSSLDHTPSKYMISNYEDNKEEISPKPEDFNT